jgi:signal transduction histidine kinase
VQWLVEDVGRTYRLGISLDGPEDASPLSERLRVLLFRAVRELLINVAKHAGAKRARVRLERGARDIRIVVEDDGQAFDPATVGSRGLGLSGIRERLSHLGGAMSIVSAPGRGTCVTLVAPLDRAAQRSAEREDSGR